MDVIDYIQENADGLVLLQHYGFKGIREYDNSIRACCAIHGGNNPNAFILNKKNNLWYCYTGDCGGGDVVELVKKMESISFKEAIYTAADILGLNIDDMSIPTSRDGLKIEQKKWIRMMKDEEVNDEQPYELPYTKYYPSSPFFNRFSQEVIDFYDAKFCNIFPLEESVLKDKMVIPIYKNGILIGVSLRDMHNGFPKWFHHPKGLKTSNLLYNYDNAVSAIQRGNEEIILVEGIFDVWAYHRIGIENAVAVFGSNLSKHQIKEILKLNVTVTLSFDNDDAGNKATEKAIKSLSGMTVLKKITLPEGKDPCDCSENELMNSYLSRQVMV